MGLILFNSIKNDINEEDKVKKQVQNDGMKIESKAFENNQQIPSNYTCDGQNINPPLAFSDVPEQAKSLLLILEDPDAPMGTLRTLASVEY